MTRRLIGALAVITTLLLSGCGNDYGVDQYGQKVASERVDKQWLVVNYWAEWCGPCRIEIPELNALAEQLKGQPVSVFGVNFDNVQGEELKSASEKLGIKFTVLAQNPEAIFDIPRSEALPVSCSSCRRLPMTNPPASTSSTGAALASHSETNPPVAHSATATVLCCCSNSRASTVSSSSSSSP